MKQNALSILKLRSGKPFRLSNISSNKLNRPTWQGSGGTLSMDLRRRLSSCLRALVRMKLEELDQNMRRVRLLSFSITEVRKASNATVRILLSTSPASRACLRWTEGVTVGEFAMKLRYRRQLPFNANDSPNYSKSCVSIQANATIKCWTKSHSEY